MRGAVAFIIFLIFCAVLVLLNTGGQGIPATGWFSPDPAAMDATAAAHKAAARESEDRAQQVRAQQAQMTASALDTISRQTQAAWDVIAQQTAEVESTQTQAAWQVTVEADKARAAQTLEAQHAQATATQIVVHNKATADALVLISESQKATQTAEENQIELKKKAFAADVAYQTRYFPTIFLILFGVILVGFGGFTAIWLLKMRDDTNVSITGVDPMTGRALPFFAKGKSINPDLSMVPVQDPRAPLQAGTQQVEFDFRDQTVRGIYGANRIGARANTSTRVGPGLQLTETRSEPPAADNELPVDVSWSLMDQWPGKKFTLGQGAGGQMISLDPDDDAAPHLMMVGTSGAGKTHFGLHPVIAQALASGWQVIILDRSGVGFGMFADHPNARLILLDQPEQASSYLESAYQEIVRRQRLLTGAGPGVWKWSQWKQAPDPRVMIVADEFSNLADGMANNQERELLWRRARMIAAEGRKAGILLAIALQDPTHKSIDLRIRRNCTKMAFQVLDSDVSHVILGTGGAEKLAWRHFMTVLNARVLEGVAFDVPEPEIRRFLTNHPVPALPDPQWIKAEEKIVEPEEESKVQIIRRLKAEGNSMNEIQLKVFGTIGGAAFYSVKAALGDTTTTESTSTVLSGA
jgi:hypothetical protein